ncbi:hypothetical protein ACFLUU_04230 [Chloroflexota bacterium]
MAYRSGSRLLCLCWPPLFPSYHITEEEIITSGWDYIVLGHLLTFGCVCNEPAKAYYSGSYSLSGTVAIVDLDKETGCRLLVIPYEMSSMI